MSAFKAGDRVRVLSGETECQTGEIECIWHSEGRADTYAMGEYIYQADELELLPEKREPKPGEVWAWVMQVLSEGRVSHLENGMICYAESGHEELGKHGKFLADSPATYFKARPC